MTFIIDQRNLATIVYRFADDNNLLYVDKSLRSLENTVNAELSNVSKWLLANKLSLNVRKLKALCSFLHSVKYLQISYSTLHKLWPSGLGPSCSI